MIDKKEIAKCFLCHNANCNKNSKGIDVARIIRALYFDNDIEAKYLTNVCFDEKIFLEVGKKCPAGVNIYEIVKQLKDDNSIEDITEDILVKKVDLSTDICGVKLENPFLLSSSVVSSTYDMCARAFEMGWAGAAFKTISLMSIHEASPRFYANKSPYGWWYGFKNIEQLSDHSLKENAKTFKRLKRDFPNKVIIASIMGRSEKEWEYLAKVVTDAGADVIECNFSCPNMEESGTGSDVGQDKNACKKYSQATRRGTRVPILAKMTPNITDICEVAIASIEGGADGIAAINTIKSISEVNIDTLVAAPSIHGKSMIGGYSGPATKPIALKFITDLYTNKNLKSKHISAMGGITTWKDALEFILLGANSIQITTAVMQYGYRIIDDLISGLKNYMILRNYSSLRQLIGLGSNNVVENNLIERDTIVYPIIDKDKCLKCGRCYVSCRDGGHQALSFDNATNEISLDGKKCVGCQLCSLVCPVSAISTSRRVKKVKI